MKNNKEKFETFVEVEEKRYHPQPKIRISPKQACILALLAMGVVLGNVYSINSNPRIEHCSEWDGAGDTWTCSKCGTKNYNWQISCSNCR